MPEAALFPPIHLTKSTLVALSKQRELTENALRFLVTHELMRVADMHARSVEQVIYHTFTVGEQEFICTPQGSMPQHCRVIVDTCTRALRPIDDPRFLGEPVSVPIADTGNAEYDDEEE